MLYLICRGSLKEPNNFIKGGIKMKVESYLKKVCKKTKQISNGRYTCKIGFDTKFGGKYYIYLFDTLCFINPRIGYATNNIKKWFTHRVLGYNFQQDELDDILFDEGGKHMEVQKAAKALIDAFKFINLKYKEEL